MLASFDFSAAISSAGSRPATPEIVRETHVHISQLTWASQIRRADPVFSVSVALGRGRTRLTYLGVLGSAALAAVVALSAAGCSSPAPAQAVTSSVHSLTIGQARSEYSSYVAAAAAAAKQGDQVQGLSIVADAQWSLLHAQYAALSKTGTPVTQYSYGTPTFYVPALANFPQWFVVAVPVTTVTGAQRAPAVNTVMVFQRISPAEQWTVDGSAALDQPLPPIALASDGYATSVSTHDPSLLLPPDLVGPTQAAVVDEGPAAPAGAAIASGPQTTGLYATAAALDHSYAAQGLTYEWLLEGAALPEFALRTADGGALVLYAMYLNTTIEHPGNVFGALIPIPANFAPIITTPATQQGDHGVNANWTYEFAAVDPPSTAHGAKAQVVAGSGGPTYGHTY
jgi:hypothetical protein